MSFVKRFFFAQLFCAVFFASPFLFAEVEVKEEKLFVGGELRLRNENQINFASFVPSRASVDDDAFVLLRARMSLRAKPVDAVQLFLQPQFSRTFAQEESTVANGTAIDDLDLHQAYVDLNIKETPLLFRLGRQELLYGDERLIGNFDWSNVGRSFDAIKMRLQWKKYWIDTFASWIQRAGGNQYFGGVYGHIDLHDALSAETFALLLRDNDGGLGGGALTLYTLGTHFFGHVSSWDYALQHAFQVGTSGNSSVFAYAGHLHGGYTFDVRVKPRVGVEYNIASGDDDPANGKVKTFNNLFPTNHNKYGYVDLVGWRNIHNPRLSFGIKPLASLQLLLDYHLFFLMEPADGLYQASGAQLRAGNANASRFVGHEIDFLAKYAWNEYADFLVGYSLFKTEQFFSDTGLGKTAHFFSLQTTARF
ncbi:MAG: hypothetical protein A3C46_08485 [Deltaproteobacteria bacterium RIFCSPHIGHO2_02_FULL_44_16]|nr:MAG: hypothetical protein A3C46_08485 [Deltaproteobacteria bacterium RIFCSPHIGHO2_02_FULL_44_16]